MYKLISCLLVNFLFSTALNAMTVEEAYKAIPHRQTTYDINQAKMEYNEAIYLENLFTIVDLAMVEKVNTLIWFNSNGIQGNPYTNYKNRVNQLLLDLNNLEPPEKLEEIHNLITESIIQQSKYFYYANMWRRIGIRYKFNPDSSRILNVHSKLIEAYNQLMNTYPNEDNHNKQAFFDHLCALDFI